MMIKDDWITWLGGTIAIVIYLFIVLGCASQPEPLPPIADYRVLHGFNP